MATYAQNSCTLSTVTDVQSIYTYHLLAPSTTVITNNMAPKDATIDNPGNPPGASSITITYLGDDYVWTISEPGINIQTNDIGTLYYIECTLFSDNTFDWGPIMTSSSYEAAKQAFNKATIVSNLVGDSPQHFWWLTSPEEVSPTITHPAGAYVTYVSQESFKNNPNNQPNLLLQSEGISLRNGLTTKAQMTSTGLEVLEGGIKGGQVGSNGFIYLSTIDYPLKNSTITPSQSGLTINGHTPTARGTDGRTTDDYAWRQVIGTKFGVDSEGNLYANNAHLSNAEVEGAITATSLTIGSGSNVYDGQAAINASGYTIEIIDDVTAAYSGATIGENNTYLYPIMYLNGVKITSGITNTDYIWYLDGATTGGTRGHSSNGGIVAEYGHTYRVTYQFNDSVVGQAQPTLSITVDPSKYITRISEAGITVHPEDTSNNNFLRITASGVDIVKNNTTIASYGSDITIGFTSGKNVFIDSNGIQLKNSSTVLANFGANQIQIGQAGASRTIIDTNGLTVYKGTDNVAEFGTTARIGKLGNSRFLVNSSSLQAYSGTNSTPYFEVNANGLTWGNNTAATTAEVNAAAQTASNYLSYDSANGLQLASSSPATATRKIQILNNAIKIQNDENNYINLNSNGMQLYQNGNSIANFGSTITLGNTSSNYAFFSNDGITFYNDDRAMLDISAGQIYEQGYSYYSTGLLTKSAEGYTNPALRLTSSSNAFSNIIGLYSNDEKSLRQNYIDLISTGAFMADMGSDTEQEMMLDARLNIGHGYSSSSPGFTLSAFVEPTSSLEATDARDVSITADLSHITDSQLLISLGDRVNYTQINLIAPQGSKGEIYHACKRLTSDVALTVISDKRLKQHLTYLTQDAVDFIQSLKPARFIKDGEEHLGFYAQDIEKSNKWNAVLTPNIGDFKGLSYTELIAPLVAYCQYLEERIKQLEEK